MVRYRFGENRMLGRAAFAQLQPTPTSYGSTSISPPHHTHQAPPPLVALAISFRLYHQPTSFHSIKSTPRHQNPPPAS
ncbi:hypothetical protein CCACVL1_14688 [Corchorus capsularis]|uniref:Uncharacterized protein n=1 Tax=Corchorus capsularis TaxID=210143 RepID=A0A1R3I668_COCAP|nr:hypothetical protein CCACVL1_14688 [Corchorus capsularis]